VLHHRSDIGFEPVGDRIHVDLQSALDEAVEITDYDAVVSALARQRPLWPPGTAHGYHARTFGFLIDELVRRIDGRRIAAYWREIFAEPLALDIWIGLPAEQNDRVATIYAAKAGTPPEPAQFYRDLITPGTLPRRTFTTIRACLDGARYQSKGPTR